MTTTLVELPRHGMLLRHGPHVGYVGPTLAHVRLQKAHSARGYVLLHRDSFGAWQAYRLPGEGFQSARATANAVAKRTQRKILLGELVQMSKNAEVIRTIATYEHMSNADLLARAIGAMENVTELVKASDSDPYKKSEFDRLTNRLARDLNKKAGPRFTTAVEKAVEDAKVDWANATESQLESFSAKLAAALGLAASAVWKAIKPRVVTAATSMATTARKAFVKEHDLSINVSLALKDKRAVTRSAATNVHYVRDFATGRMEPSLSAQARGIVQRGISRGSSSRAIGAELFDKLSAAASGQTEAYFNMAASAINTRSREFSSLRSMADAGVGEWAWSSVLDELTTESCRFLDGKRFGVSGSLARYAAADALDDPLDIKYEMPWFYEKQIRGGDHDGKTGIYLNSRSGLQRVAVVEKPGFGQRDVIGTYSNAMSAKSLENSNISPPPGHGGCRSTSIPVI